MIFTVRNEAAGQATVNSVKAAVGDVDGVGELQAEILELASGESVDTFA